MKIYNTNENGALSIDNMTIPQGHRFYVQALAEVEAGEAEILPYVEPLPTVADYSAAIQLMMDEAAQANGFDNIFTAVTYADEDSVPSFKAHGLALRAWRSLVWDSAYALMAQVESGEMPQPTIADLIAMLPAFEV